MGLDWMLADSKPKPGCVTEYRRIKAKLAELDDDDKLTEEREAAIRKDLRAALEQVAVSAYEVIGAPRVGIDQEATNWFRKNIYEPMQVRVAEEKKKPVPRNTTSPKWDDRNDGFIAQWDRPFADLLKEQTGKFVVELAKKKEGIAAITGIMCGAVDFRGKAVAMSVVISEELRNEAFDDHDADACLDYADRLEASLHEYQAEHPDWQARKEKDEYGGAVDAKDDVETLEAAVKWLRFWGSEGFGYSGWY